MIQRIQTLYLAVSALLSGLLLKGDIARMVTEDGSGYSLAYNGIRSVVDGMPVMVEKSLPLAVLLAVLPVMFIIAIFLFKRRKLQLRLTVFATLLFAGALLLILYYIVYTGNKLDSSLVFTVKITFPVIGLVTGYLAFRAILKDELLVKSYDRIR